MRLEPVLAIALALVLAAPAGAVVTTYKRVDEIAGTATYYVELREAQYADVSNEEAIHLNCDKTGQIALVWHIGGRHTGTNYRPFMIDGRWYSDEDIVYRIDGAPAIATKLSAISTQDGVRALLASIAAAKVFLLKVSWADESSHFDLKGFAQAVGPASDFGRQCLR